MVLRGSRCMLIVQRYIYFASITYFIVIQGSFLLQIIPGNRYAKLHIYLRDRTLKGRLPYVCLTMSWIERCVGSRRSRLAYAKLLPRDRAFDEGLLS